MANKDLRVRFAPSPTGNLHVGNARVAIFNWLYAKHNNGTYLLRIEDTDVKRSTKEYLESQLNSLKWLGLMPDESIYYQMSRAEEHKKVLNDLLKHGYAYPCFCDPDELEKKRAKKIQAGQTYKYDGTCRNLKYTKDDLKKPHAIRFKLPEDIKRISFNDMVRGKITIDIDQLDDFIIMRRDGTPTYNFVVVLDDIYMKISHVIRGEDHISNTPKQILIYKVLGKTIPKFAHLPMILGPQGNKLSKRDVATSVKEYMHQGFLPDALFNYLVRLGWSHGNQEIFTKEEMIKFFNFDHVGKKGAIFDIKKLEWLNGVYLRQKTFDELLAAIKNLDNGYYQKLNNLWNIEQLKSLFDLYKQRVVKLLDMVLDIISLSQDPKDLNLELIKKWKTPKTLELLKLFLDKFSRLENSDHAKLLDLAKKTCENFNIKLVNLAQPLRLALTGKITSPGIFDLISILDKDRTLKRVRFLMSILESND